MATLIFEISWDADVRAELRMLRDNNVALLTQSIVATDGRITLQWESNDQIAHHLDWELWAPGRKMKNLSAIAAWEHADPVDLANDDDATTVWAKGGDL